MTIIYILVLSYLFSQTMQLQAGGPAQHGARELTELTFTSTSVLCLASNVESEILFHITTDCAAAQLSSQTVTQSLRY